LSCDICGASYPADGYCEPCGTGTGTGPAPAGEFLPLVGLANVLVILLSLVLTVIAATLSLRHFGETSWQVHGTVVASWLDTAGSLMILAFAVLFVVWFRRARINAERHGYRQRRARGWTFWGWIIPIVSLWFPFQLMGDIWRAGLPAERRGRTAWLPALWWTCWLLSPPSFEMGTRAGYPRPLPGLSPDIPSASLCALGLAGVALIAIILRVADGPVGSESA
jgi:hypothetical protein